VFNNKEKKKSWFIALILFQ